MTWIAGTGVGIMARLNKRSYLNSGANYMFGGPVNYFDRNQINNWEIELSPTAASSAVGEGTLYKDDVLINAIPKRSITHILMANSS